MSAGLRCMCHGVTYTSVSSYLAAHGDAEQLELELDDAAGRHPSARTERFVGTFADGSQVLLEQSAAGKMTAAVRADRYTVWGPPAMLDEAP